MSLSIDVRIDATIYNHCSEVLNNYNKTNIARFCVGHQIYYYLWNAIFHSAFGFVEYCIPQVVINLDIQRSSVL